MTSVRVGSAMIAGLIVVAAIYFFRETGVGVLAAIIALLSLVEFAAIALAEKAKSPLAVIFVLCGLGVFTAGFYNQMLILPALSLASMVLMATHLFAARNQQLSLQELVTSTGLSVWGLVYAALSPLYIYFIAVMPPKLLWFFFTAVIVFAGDTAAYFFGIRFGKTRLYKRVSPKKSVEGAIASIFASVAAGILYKIAFIPDLALFWVLAVSILVSIAAQVGDLCESLLKRAYDTKDSGSIMPGHGGILDRLDGVYFAVPVVYLFVMWLRP